MKEKFTRGVWQISDCREIDDAEYDYSIVDADGWNIAHIANCNLEEQEANAALIACAPTLYKMLKLACHELTIVADWCGENGMKGDEQCYYNLVNGIQDVLKKARGEE